MAACGAKHPEDSSRTCMVTGPHGDHMDRNPGTWPNTEVLERHATKRAQRPKGRRERKATLGGLSARIREGRAEMQAEERAQQQEALGIETPIVRSDDPETSHEAARRYQPKRDSAKGRVLAYLQSRLGEWVDAPELTAQEVGGFAGTRRLRELRESGWPIETRPKPGGGTNTWQHRLVSDVAGP